MKWELHFDVKQAGEMLVWAQPVIQSVTSAFHQSNPILHKWLKGTTEASSSFIALFDCNLSLQSKQYHGMGVLKRYEKLNGADTEVPRPQGVSISSPILTFYLWRLHLHLRSRNQVAHLWAHFLQ